MDIKASLKATVKYILYEIYASIIISHINHSIQTEISIYSILLIVKLFEIMLNLFMMEVNKQNWEVHLFLTE